MAAWGVDYRRDEIARVVRALITRYEWQLVEDDWLIARAGERLATLPPTAGNADIERLCKDEVSWELFDACIRGGLRSASAEERTRQELAYHDLGTYLGCIAAHLRSPAPGVEPADLVQETLIAIRQ